MRIRKEQLNTSLKSLLFAMIMMHAMISGFFQHVLYITSNANLYVLLCWVLVFLISIVFRVTYNLHTSSILLVGLIFIYYIISKYIIGGCVFYSIQIVFFAIIPILMATQNVNIKKVLEYIMYLSLLSVPFLDVLFAYQYEGYQQASMGNSYSVMVPVIATLIHFRYYKYNTNYKIRLLYCYNLFLLLTLVANATRGAILSLIVCFFILYINKFESNGEKRIKQNSKIIFILVMLCIVYVIIILNLESIVFFLKSVILSKLDNVPSFITKTIALLEHKGGDISNGRVQLYKVVFSLIKQNPILGHGIGTFSTYTSYPWAHNYLLQFMFEGGIILAIIPIYVTIRIIIFMLVPFINDKNEFCALVLMFCMCIPRYLISNDPWRGTAVWMMISFCCSYFFKIRKRGINYKEKRRNNL